MTEKVFISHGHDELTKHKLKDFVRDQLKLEPIVLSEQPDLGLTIVEKLEHYGKNCDFALIVLTADDQTASGGLRARQNVIHELGYFHGLLGRNRVLLLKEPKVELFSNISGLIYKEFPRGSIKLVFEDIRLAINAGDASKYAVSVPLEDKSSSRELLHEVGKEFNKTTSSIAQQAKDALLAKIRSLPDSLPPKVRYDRIKSLLESEYDLWKKRGVEVDKDIHNDSSSPAEVLGKVMHIARRSQVSEIEQCLLECLQVLTAWDSSGTKGFDWIESAITEIENTLSR